jgi:pectate lyase
MAPAAASTARGTAPLSGQAPAAGLLGFAAENGGTTGGAGGRTVQATTLAELTALAKSQEPLVITIDRTLSGGTQGASVRVASNKTLLGVGTTGFLEGVGLNISGSRNIIVQNLKFTMSTVTNTYSNDEGRQQVAANDGDCMTIQGNSQNIWVDHCEFFNQDPATQPNQDLYDGLVDAKGASAYITLSWNYFHDHHKSHLMGNSDQDVGDRKVTFHHNYYANIHERVPLYRFGTGHVFNNYFRHVYGTGINSRMGACLRVEKNYFEDGKDPIITKNSAVVGGWDVADNYYSANKGSQPTTSTCTFTPPYSYAAALTPVADVKAVVLQGAGIGKL